MQIIVKHYNHLNKAFPKWDTPQGTLVKSKDHYDRLMKENNMITYEESVERSKNNGNKPYVTSDKAWAIIKAAKNSADKKGNIKGLGDKTIEAMKSIGAIDKKIPAYMKIPERYMKQGGFEK